ncbi:hypothetical protein SANA_27820 [Gottschalkiaceae bacterium SANA]|nr:hypothetical protein SANA_27820 [Gottschalkiaceae bacterium SANA]
MGYVTIDAGTTNMRVRYIEKGKIRSCVKVKAGVRMTAIDGNNKRLKVALRDAITECLEKAEKTLEETHAILASGMITSNLGLIEIPHLPTPVGIEELASGMEAIVFLEIVEKPIYFIPGVKNKIDPKVVDLVGQLDMMRGEEAEALGAGIIQEMEEAFVFVSPGSHTKFVFVDENQKIQSCCTTLTGELLAAISGHTILSDSLSESLIQTIDPDFIKMGMDAAKKYGLTKACFLVRVLDTLRDTSDNERANFLAGALAYNDLLALLSRAEMNMDILIGGNRILQELYYEVFLSYGWTQDRICMLNSEAREKASSALAIKLFEGLSIRS